MNGKCSLREVRTGLLRKPPSIMVGIALFTLFLVQVGNATQTADNQKKETSDMKRRQIVAVRIATPPKIDGVLDDLVWKKVQPSEGFTQTKPDKGKQMSQLTVIRILVTGKVGKQSRGLLNVQADEVDEISSTNFSAFRLQRDILHSSSAGIIFLNKAQWEGEGNQTFGADLRFNPKEGVSIFGSLAKTWTDGLHDKDLAGKISGYWETETSEIGASFSDIQKNFNPEMGFVNRKDIRNGDLWGYKSFKIRRSIFRSVGAGGHYGVGLDHDGHLKDRHLGMRAGLELETGDFAEMWYDRNWEHLDEGWEIREGILIPAGMHRNNLCLDFTIPRKIKTTMDTVSLSGQLKVGD